MARVAIVDYGLCNLDSIRRAVEICGGDAFVTSDPARLSDANQMILPGVGSFGAAMSNLQNAGLDREIRRQVDAGIPLLGICLGMQLLASRSSEGGDFEGLDLIPGDVTLLERQSDNERIPHIGWNSLVMTAPEDPLFAAIPPNTDFYFVHSYHFKCADADSAIAHSPYCGTFTAAVRRRHVTGVQFHPEKSQRHGFRLLTNFLTG